MTDQQKQNVNAWLAEIKRLSAEQVELEAEHLAKISAINAEFAVRAAEMQGRTKLTVKCLLAYLQKNASSVFPGKTDRVALTDGIILRQISWPVRHARHITVEFLRQAGLPDGIRVEESVNWPEIESWPVDQLAAIGTERGEKETFSYELT